MRLLGWPELSIVRSGHISLWDMRGVFLDFLPRQHSLESGKASVNQEIGESGIDKAKALV